jgi:D-sedoheptulose 7-phosphate isomerase
MNAADLLDRQFEAHAGTVADTLAALREPFAELVETCAKAIRAGGKILFLGNGGSAADAQHLAAELVVRFQADRPAIAALALTTDTSLLTAAGNDLGYETIFARQIEALARPEDVVIGISTSGESENVVRALAEARRIGAATVAFTGRGGGRLADLSDVLIAVPSDVTARTQEMHILLGHVLCEALEVELGLTPGQD